MFVFWIPCIFIFSTLLLPVSSEYNLTIVHINDFHSHWLEFNDYEKICSEEESIAGKCYGGFPRLLTLIREIREKEKNVLLLSSGEFFYGRSHNALHGWKLANQLLPLLKLDAMSLSNHDFGRGILELSAFLYKMEFPVLCSNMWARNTSFLFSRVNKSAILEVNGEKIGIVGYLHPEALDKSRFATSVKFFPEIPAVKDEVADLVGKGINKIIALGHSEYYTDLEIAKQVKDVDIVIGGNSYIVFEKSLEEDRAEPVLGNIYENYPRLHHHDVEPESKHVNKTLILHIPQHGKYVGVVRITFDDFGTIIQESGEPVLLDNTIPQDQETLQFLKKARSTLEALIEDYRMPDRDETLAVLKSDLDGRSRTCRLEECSLGNFVADAILYMYDKNREQKYWEDVDAAVINSGMLRYSIQAGNVTLRDIFHAMFTGDLLQRANMTGMELKNLMEHAVENYDPSGVTPSGSFLQISGLKVEYDLRKPPGSRVRSFLVRDKNSKANYTPLQLDGIYCIVMPSFVRIGNDGFASSNLTDVTETGQAEFLLLVDYLREMEVISPTTDGRISFYKEMRDVPFPSPADSTTTAKENFIIEDILKNNRRKSTKESSEKDRADILDERSKNNDVSEIPDSKKTPSVNEGYELERRFLVKGGDTLEPVSSQSVLNVSIASQQTAEETLTIDNSLKLSTVLEIVDSSLGDLERIFLKAVVSAEELNTTISSEKEIENLKGSLKENLKKYLQARTEISTYDPVSDFKEEGGTLLSSSILNEKHQTEGSKNEILTGENLSSPFFEVRNSGSGSFEKAPKTDGNLQLPNEINEYHKEAEAVHDLLAESVVESVLGKVKDKLFHKKNQKSNELLNEGRIIGDEEPEDKVRT